MDSNVDRYYKVAFENLTKDNGDLVSNGDKRYLQLFYKTSLGEWQKDSEFKPDTFSDVIEEQSSALILLVLDCTTSLGSEFSSLQDAAKKFVETLVSSNSGGGSGSSQSYTISVSANPSNGGAVSGGGTYNLGAYRTVQATANDGYTFTNWTENGNEVSTDANYSFTLITNRNLVANFTENAPIQYTISVSASPTEGGTVSGGGTYNLGSSRTVKATANDDYTFTSWTENDSVVSTSANYTFTLTSNRTLVANFTANAPNHYTISVFANPTEGGTASGDGTFDSGNSCTVKATANDGYTFTNWTENDNVVSTNANYTFTVNANRTLVANFTANVPNQCTISIYADPEEGGTISGGGTYLQNQSCRLTATPASGYTFVNWTKNGTPVSTNASYTFTVTETATYIAHFQPKSYTITATADPTSGGNVSGDGIYTYGQSCTLHAYANSGYTFTKWTENGTIVSTDVSYSFNVNRNRTLLANFELTYVPSQSLQFEWNSHVYYDGEIIECTNDEYGIGEFVQHMQIRNLTSESIRIIIEKQVIQDLEGAIDYFCWGTCFSPEVIVSPYGCEVFANSLNDDELSFHVLYQEGIYGVVIIKYYAYDENNPSERISIVVRYNRR